MKASATAVSILLGCFLVGCTSNSTPTRGSTATTTQAAPPTLFRDVTPGSGLAFTYKNGEDADHYAILESLGGGVALFDYNRDGLLDIFVTGGGHFGPNKEILGYSNRLYRNLGNLKFRDVTADVGLPTDAGPMYSHGVAVADYDNDGWLDLLITGYGRMVLYHNEIAKPEERTAENRHEVQRFRDVTAAAGLLDKRELHWSTSAAWGDFNGDGLIDLFVAHYVDWSWKNHPICGKKKPEDPREICHPIAFKPLMHALFLNNGKGTFREATQEAGLKAGKGLGVLVTDLNDDGKVDAYVANDTTLNFLYLNETPAISSSPPYEGGVGGVARRNNWPVWNGASLDSFMPVSMRLAATPPNPPFVRGGGRNVGGGGGKRAAPVRFAEVAEQRGCAGSESGKPDGSMGVDAADYDGSGRMSIFVTNFSNEMHALYRRLPNGQYQHASVGAWINAIGLSYVGFGTGFFDFDRDGLEDIVITNGQVARQVQPPDTRAQLPVLFHNVGQSQGKVGPVRFVPVTERAGPYFRQKHMGRGLALGDLDNDGRIDLVVSHSNAPVTILRNELDNANHWLGIGLVGKANPDAVGAKITLEVAGKTMLKVTKNGGSYLSAGDPRVVFGLGSETKVGRLTVRWPSGRIQTWDGLKPDQYWVLVEGEAEPEVIRTYRTTGNR